MDRWNTFPVEFQGGLITNVSQFQQGTKLPGSARSLKNYEVSIDGGYRRINGYIKFTENYIPPYGTPLVQGSGQTGTTLVLGNIFTEPFDGDQLTIDGVSGTYTIDAGGVAFNSNGGSVTLTLTTPLDSSPADKAEVSFLNTNRVVTRGVVVHEGRALVVRGSDIWFCEATGFDFTKLNVPDYGTVLVDGGGQTGTSLVVDGIDGTPKVGDSFKIDGVEKVYVLQSTPTVTSGAATLSIAPALDSSPSDNATITWLTRPYRGTNVVRKHTYTIAGEDRIAIVDGTNSPVIFRPDSATLTFIDSAGDADGSSHVVWFKNQLIFGNGSDLISTAPYTDDNFSVALGAAVIPVNEDITALAVFRDQCFIFSRNTIQRLVGDTSISFNVQSVTRDIGCIAADTVQEVGGDVMFLAPDGLRLLGATDRIGDFNIGVASKQIQNQVEDLISAAVSFTSLVIRTKSQYRIFAYRPQTSQSASLGLIACQPTPEPAFEWSEIVGVKAFTSDSDVFNQEEIVLFANEDGYLYQLDRGPTFDGSNIVATMSTPFFFLAGDPRLRTTPYKLYIYVDPEGGTGLDINLKFDYDTLGLIQPNTISLDSGENEINRYGSPSALYGAATYGGKAVRLFSTPVIGSGFSVSVQMTSDTSYPPHVLSAIAIEYAVHDRR